MFKVYVVEEVYGSDALIVCKTKRAAYTALLNMRGDEKFASYQFFLDYMLGFYNVVEYVVEDNEVYPNF